MCLTVILYNIELVSHAQPLESQRSLHGAESNIVKFQSILAMAWTFPLLSEKGALPGPLNHEFQMSARKYFLLYVHSSVQV